jgi:hypothetical protein
MAGKYYMPDLWRLKIGVTPPWWQSVCQRDAEESCQPPLQQYSNIYPKAGVSEKSKKNLVFSKPQLHNI